MWKCVVHYHTHLQFSFQHAQKAKQVLPTQLFPRPSTLAARLAAAAAAADPRAVAPTLDGVIAFDTDAIPVGHFAPVPIQSHVKQPRGETTWREGEGVHDAGSRLGLASFEYRSQSCLHRLIRGVRTNINEVIENICVDARQGSLCCSLCPNSIGLFLFHAFFSSRFVGLGIQRNPVLRLSDHMRAWSSVAVYSPGGLACACLLCLSVFVLGVHHHN